MSQNAVAEQLLTNYLQGFLWVDEEWRERDGTSATYWQARLPQTTNVEVLPDGRTKWQVRTRIVEGVPDSEAASLLCLALNRYAVGWSFAYNAKDLTVDAIVAISVPPEWDTFFLRLSEKAKLSAWMSDVIAERLAEVLGGVPAFSHPDAQPGLREAYDGTYHYLETIRGRPEWVLDLTRHRFPPMEDIAAAVGEMVGAPPDGVQHNNSALRIELGSFGGRPVALQAGFGNHAIAGESWWSSVQLPCARVSGPLAGQLMGITWALFNDPETNLLGGWTHDDGRLVFQQWNTMSEARSQEQLGSFNGHLASDLWGFTSTLSDVLGELSQQELPPDHPDSENSEPIDYCDIAGRVIAAIVEQAWPAVSVQTQEDGGPADRRLLWLEHRETLVVAAWFNPMGPTVSTTELCALPDGTEYIVHYRRHPFAPFYRVLGRVESREGLMRLVDEANNLLLDPDGSLPNVLVIWQRAEAAASDVPDQLRDRVIAVAELGGENLAAEAAWIAHTMGKPWTFAAVDHTEARQVKAAASRSMAPDHGFATWWHVVSNPDNVIANLTHIPDAWDGALNSQKVHGNLRLFDVGPMVVTYSDIGMPAPETDSARS
jgi:hypothetical protein